MTLARIANRLFSNLLLPDRAAGYGRLLDALAANGYRTLTIRDLAAAVRSGAALPERLAVLRHDIDTDPQYARVWAQVEARHGFSASYYFRLRTLAVDLMQHIEQSGSEASYHYEELASYAKRHGVSDRRAMLAALEPARLTFAENYQALKERSRLPLRTVAAHGDFVNRALGVANMELLAEEGLRTRLGILAEAYDPDLQAAVPARISDAMYPEAWRSSATSSPERIIESGAPGLQILTHPRHWRANILSNLREDADRFVSGLLFAARRPAGRYIDWIDRRRSLIRA